MWIAVPLGLELSPLEPRHHKRLLLAWLPSASIGLLSFFGEIGSGWGLGGGVLYLAFCACVALGGLQHLLGAKRDAASACACLGLLVLPVAGAWHLAERMGWTVLGFSGLWAGLTAAHFHFAGFATPVLLGLGLGRAARAGAERTRLWIEVGLLVAGVPCVALGITFSPALALFGTVCMALPIWSYGIRTLREVGQGRLALPGALLGLSALVPFVTLSLALVWSLSVVLKVTWLDLDQMIRYHGLLNALGFISLGFFAERLALWRRRGTDA